MRFQGRPVVRLIAFVSCVLAWPALAADAAATSATSVTAATSFTSATSATSAVANLASSSTAAAPLAPNYTGLSLALLMLVGLAALALTWMSRRGVGGRLGGASVMRVVAAQRLGQRERVLVVNVGNRFFMLGQTASQISMLAELAPDDVPSSAARPIENPFAELLNKIKNRQR